MPTGWRRWYHEFKSLGASLPLVPFEVVTSDGTPTFILARFGPCHPSSICICKTPGAAGASLRLELQLATCVHFRAFGMQIDKWQAQNKDKEQTKQDYRKIGPPYGVVFIGQNKGKLSRCFVFRPFFRYLGFSRPTPPKRTNPANLPQFLRPRFVLKTLRGAYALLKFARPKFSQTRMVGRLLVPSCWGRSLFRGELYVQLQGGIFDIKQGETCTNHQPFLAEHDGQKADLLGFEPFLSRKKRRRKPKRLESCSKCSIVAADADQF